MRLNIITFLAALFGDQLACQVEFLRCENRLLRKRVDKQLIRLTPEERYELIKYGKALGSNLKDIISIVRYYTFLGWLRNSKKGFRTFPYKKRGPRRKAPETRKLVVEMAKKNAWGITRILGELRRLKITYFSRSTIANILKENGIPPADQRKEPWINGLKRHYDTLVACDFFRQWIWTLQGPRLAWVLFYINIRTRRIKIAGISRNPKGAWTLEQSKKVFEDDRFTQGGKQILIRDLDCKFSKEFDKYFKEQGFRVFKTPKHSPNLNAFAETWVGKIRKECVNHFVIFGMKHLEYLVNEYANYYNTKRPHMNLGFMPPDESPPQKSEGRIRSSPILGGLHHYYYKE
ncbi:MAG: transposase [Candidatus Omnitrophica bacterium]|nr:transposase [Candidatus Omnitrophota bacterium]